MTTLATDTFSRTLTGSWGNADTGGAWTVTSGTPFTVDGSQGRISTVAGSTALARLPLSTTGGDVLISITPAALPNAGYLYHYVHARSLSESASSTTSYGAIVQVGADGTVAAIIRVNGTGVLSSGTIPGLTVAAGTTLLARVRASGTSPTTISAKVWKTGTAEPAAWTVTSTDSTAGLQSAGGIAVGTFMSSTASNGPISVGFDALTVTDVSGTPPTVNAGPDVSATTGTAKSLTGTATGNSGATIASTVWTCTAYPGATAPTLTGASTLTVSFTPAASGSYTFQLTATDSNGLTNTDTAVVTAASAATPTVRTTVNTAVAKIDATTSTPGTAGDTLTYTISPATGTSQPSPGIFLVPLPTVATVYTVTATGAPSGTVSAGQVTVPAGTSYTGQPVVLSLPSPLDPATDDQWGAVLNDDLTALMTAINSLIGFYNQNIVA